MTLQVSGSSATITLADPSGRNSINLQSARQLLDAVVEVERLNVAVVGIRAVGNFFSVGGDLREFASTDDRRVYFDDLTNLLHRTVSKIVRLDAIVIAAVSGPAAGAGVSLAAAADIVLAGRSASFRLAYTAIGLSPDGGCTALLPPSIGLHRSLYLALLNPQLSAEDAKAAGLVAEVVPDDLLESRLAEVTAALAAGPHSAQAATKHLLRNQVAATVETQLELEARAMVRAGSGQESVEGVNAFLGKRPALFGEDPR